MATVEHINEAEFTTKVLQSQVPVMVDFYAQWCGPCRMLAPVLDSVATKLADQALIFKVDTDHNQNLAAQYQVSGIPCLIFFKNGQEVARLVGYQSEDKIITQLKN